MKFTYEENEKNLEKCEKVKKNISDDAKTWKKSHIGRFKCGK